MEGHYEFILRVSQLGLLEAQPWENVEAGECFFSQCSLDSSTHGSPNCPKEQKQKVKGEGNCRSDSIPGPVGCAACALTLGRYRMGALSRDLVKVLIRK